MDKKQVVDDVVTPKEQQNQPDERRDKINVDQESAQEAVPSPPASEENKPIEDGGPIEQEDQGKQENTGDFIETMEGLEKQDQSTDKVNNHHQQQSQADKSIMPITETQEVTSSTNPENPPKSVRPRRLSYQNSRGHVGGSFQNYGLTYLPYKSNFEPSEDARRRADEFLKTLKL